MLFRVYILRLEGLCQTDEKRRDETTTLSWANTERSEGWLGALGRIVSGGAGWGAREVGRSVSGNQGFLSRSSGVVE